MVSCDYGTQLPGNADGMSGWPGGEQRESLGGGGARLGGVDHEDEPGFGGDDKFFVGEGELADDGVAELLGADAVGAKVVRTSKGPGGVAAGAQFPDQVLQGTIVGSRSASARMIATHISANRSHSWQKPREAGSRNWNRARLGFGRRHR
jgi:hypothetical protein